MITVNLIISISNLKTLIWLLDEKEDSGPESHQAQNDTHTEKHGCRAHSAPLIFLQL